MNERKAIYRQLQHYFDTKLFGLYRWKDVKHRDAEPVVIERDESGRRINQKSIGRVIERAVVEFDGYILIVQSANESQPDKPGEPLKPAVMLYDGPPARDNLVVEGANIDATWQQVTELLRRNISEGKKDDYGSAQRSAGR